MKRLPLNSLIRMRWRLLLVVSACVNVALFAAWLAARKAPAPAIGDAGLDTNSTAPHRPLVVVRKQFFSWDELESPDYATYIANLRDINCPAQTIRDIIIADVNAVFARRRAEIQPSQEQWWRSAPDAATAKKLRDLEAERRNLLAKLLGPDWDGQAALAQQKREAGVSLDGPVLGLMPDEVKRAINAVVAESQRRMEELQAKATAEGRKPTSAELAELRDLARVEMQKILTPPQLEEFLLRYSQNATELRAELGDLRYFNASPSEFRALFRARDQFDQKLAALADSIDPRDFSLRQSLEEQRERAIKLALGPKRYEQYRQLHDPGYRDAYAQAAAAGEPGATRTVQEINQATQEEMARVRANSNMTDAQLAIAAKRVELEQLTATAQAYGQAVPPDPNAPPPPPAPPQPRVHIIKAGDTFGALSTAYGIPMRELLDANPGMQINNIRPGQHIVIPPPPRRVQ